MHCLFDVPELVDRVIDYLHRDYSSLRSCALVARIWRPSSSFHLFRSTIVATGDQLDRLEECMDANQDLVHYIQTLTIDEFSRASGWAAVDRVLRLTCAMPMLTALSLHHIFWYEESATSVGDLVGGRSVRELHLRSGVYSNLGLVRLLQAFPALRRLSVSDAYTSTSTNDEAVAQAVAAAHRIPLDELWLEDVVHGSLARVLVDVLAEGAPHILGLSLEEPQDVLDTLRLCKSIGLGVKELRVILSRVSGTNLAFPPDHIELHHLRTLRIVSDVPIREPSATLNYLFCVFLEAVHAPLLEVLEYNFRGDKRRRALGHHAAGDIDWPRVCQKFRDMRRSNPRLQIRVVLALDQEGQGCFELIRVGLRDVVDLGVVQWMLL